MKRILKSILFIIATVSIITYLFIPKNNNIDIVKDTSSIDISSIDISSIEPQKPLLKIKKVVTTDKLFINNKQNNISSIPVNRLKQDIEHQKYQYRKKEYEMHQQRIDRYLAYQSQLKYIREGGVKSKLEAVKKKREIKLKKMYQLQSRSHGETRKSHFLRQNMEKKRRREHIEHMHERQIRKNQYKREEEL